MPVFHRYLHFRCFFFAFTVFFVNHYISDILFGCLFFIGICTSDVFFLHLLFFVNHYISDILFE